MKEEAWEMAQFYCRGEDQDMQRDELARAWLAVMAFVAAGVGVPEDRT